MCANGLRTEGGVGNRNRHAHRGRGGESIAHPFFAVHLWLTKTVLFARAHFFFRSKYIINWSARKNRTRTILFSSLLTYDEKTISQSIGSFTDADLLAPYATITTTGETYFSFDEANSDGLTHFRDFGNGTIGLEDINGGGDKDYDDLIIGFDFELVS